MADLLSNLGLIVDQMFDWVVDVCDVIVANPLLLLTVGFLCIGAAVGVFGRFLSRS